MTRLTFLARLGPLLKLMAAGLPAMLAGVHETTAGMVVRAEFAGYVATRGGATEVRLVIDGDDTVAGLQPVPDGLFSAGVRLRFAPGSLSAPVDRITAAAPLDFDGFQPGAARESGADFASLQGNIDVRPDPLAPYQGTLLGTVGLMLPAGATGVVDVGLEFPRESINETVFVDGSGAPLDEDIRFEPFVVSVLPALEIGLVPGPGAGRSARLSFDPVPGFAHRVEFRDRPSSAGAGWTPLPGAPHDSGVVLDPIPVGRSARFYRLVLTPR